MMTLSESIAYQTELLYSNHIGQEYRWAVAGRLVKKEVDGKVKVSMMTQPKWARDLDSLNEWFESVFVKHDGDFNQYMPLGFSTAKVGFGQSIRKNTATLPSVLLIDMDFGDQTHKDKALPLPHREIGMELVEAFENHIGITATAIADSGGGYHVYFACEEEIPSSLIEAFKAFSGEFYAGLGWNVDSKLSFHGSQMIRAVGTKNVSQGTTSKWLRAEQSRYPLSKLLEVVPGSESQDDPESAQAGRTAAVHSGSKAKGQRPGDRFDSLVNPMEFLGVFVPIIQRDGGGTFVRPDGTFNDSELHFKPKQSDPSKLQFWGEGIKSVTGFQSGSMYAYGGFGIICNLLLGGDFKTTAYLLASLERKTGGGTKWVEAVIEFLKTNDSPEAIRAALPQKKEASKPADGARYSGRSKKVS